MATVKMDQKWRIRLPKNVRKALKLKTRQALDIEVKEGKVLITRPSPKRSMEMDPALRDMIERPLHSKIKITTELLEKLGEEQMMGL
jgi:bifunctional DNA-binding transcriptional regulator/antitoxin component of YhaV-PrlF toxin-antitoxin module